MEQKVVNYDEVVAENIRLRQLLNYKSSHPEFSMTLAGIITKDYGTWTNTFTIDKGSEEGMAVNMLLLYLVVSLVLLQMYIRILLAFKPFLIRVAQ